MSQSLLPSALTELIRQLSMLPGVGPRTAERYAYSVLRSTPAKATELATAISNVHRHVSYCPVTFAFMDTSQSHSALYTDPARDKTTIAVVEDPFDVIALEKTKLFNGTYHVLGGVISPLDGVGPEQLHIPELLRRIDDDAVTELILAMNASVEGESTAIFIQNYLKDQGVTVEISRLARGIPVGVDLEYADQITLGHALEGRRTLP